ncbi:hypothetical protein, conserved [Trypanosoma brucei brucei TREU927]|uniref:Uncharacterized protein n=1 Tax=Trypanosoma brucei brucei (strain 927/4 GUTat10.1) TaxID=185431 RepID=Q388B4_TRYB2|nr:hypothetical protein, conserved [Trypanosoma brucei brucei TREU927]EAN78858.1 hypothetical protein, conserved [Trypanosoma brucei brucei TREU927]
MSFLGGIFAFATSVRKGGKIGERVCLPLCNVLILAKVLIFRFCLPTLFSFLFFLERRSPFMTQPVDDSWYDAELLDALLGKEDVDPSHVPLSSLAAAAPATTPKGSCRALEITDLGHPRLFMIGGSLFSRYCRPSPALQYHRARFHWSRLSWLDYSAIYCPFTKQFLSPRSPHWSHLVSAGFGTPRRLLFGRSIVLVEPQKLQALAAHIQQSKEGNAVSGKNPTAMWSPPLQQTLGLLLETLPYHDETSLARRVQEVLSAGDTGAGTGRRIPLGLYNHVPDVKRVMPPPRSSQEGEEEELAQNDVDAVEVVALGESYLRRVLPWRTAVLQHRPKMKLNMKVGHKEMVGLSSEGADLHPAHSKADVLVERYSLLCSTPCCVPKTQMAYLSLRYVPDVPVMQVVVDALLRTEETEYVFYCPIEHGVDCHTVVDIVAYRVRRTGDGDVRAAERFPVLHLGLHANPTDSSVAPVIVVIGNAHLLSQRAISRLLDQWTRNGAAAVAVRRRNGGSGDNGNSDVGIDADEAVGRSWRGRELLLRIGDPLRAIACGVPLFGNVRAVFVSYSAFDCAPSDCSAHSPGLNNSVSCVRSANATVHVLKPLREGVFTLEEPVVAALRRVAPTFQRRMDVSDRRLFIKEVCDVISSTHVSTLSNRGADRHGWTTSPDDSYREEDVLLHLYEAVEAFLECPVKSGDVSLLSCAHLMTKYPELATARIRHELIREFPLYVEMNKSELTVCSAVSAPAPDSVVECAAGGSGSCECAAGFNIPLVSSRRLARKKAEEEHDSLKKTYVLNATLDRVVTSDASGCGSSFTSVIMRGSEHQRYECPIEHSYQPFFEPPLLLGRWSQTLLFCAPVVADTVALRCVLLHAAEASVRDDDTINVVDVDIFCVDYVKYPPERRCRLFGVRLRFATRDGFTKGTVKDCSAREWATEMLEHALAKCAVSAELFPLWTSSELRKQRTCRHVTQGSGVAGTFVPHFRFEALDECVRAAQPNVVEQRLFALGFVQCGPLCLTVGSHVIALRDISSNIKRGTLCRVVRFAPMMVAHEFGAPVDRMVQCFFEQQRCKGGGMGALPVVRPVLQPNNLQVTPFGEADESERETRDEEALVIPAVSLVGGYRSLHYYALPALQLPLLVPSQAAAASTLFHPLFAHQDSLLEFASAETRSKAATMIMSLPPSLGARRSVSCAFLYDAVFDDGESGAEVHEEGGQFPPHGSKGSASPSYTVCCDVLSALSLFPLRV